jgi:hypothetical protein
MCAQGWRSRLRRKPRRVLWQPDAALLKLISPTNSGAIAQLGERIVRNDEVVGSIPTSSTISKHLQASYFRIPDSSDHNLRLDLANLREQLQAVAGCLCCASVRRRCSHNSRAERRMVTPPSPPSAQSVQTKKKPPVDLAISR